jgi:hypothetical protein
MVEKVDLAATKGGGRTCVLVVKSMVVILDIVVAVEVVIIVVSMSVVTIIVSSKMVITVIHTYRSCQLQ